MAKFKITYKVEKTVEVDSGDYEFDDDLIPEDMASEIEEIEYDQYDPGIALEDASPVITVVPA